MNQSRTKQDKAMPSAHVSRGADESPVSGAPSVPQFAELSMDGYRAGPDFFRAHHYAPHPEMVERVRAGERAAAESLGGRALGATLQIRANPHGPTNHDYIVQHLRAAGIALEAPLMMRLFDRARLPQMIASGTDRAPGMNLRAHHGGSDGEWLAMIEHGLALVQTDRTTYVSPLTARVTWDVALSRHYSVAIYDARGLLSCQPFVHESGSASNGHHLFLCAPRRALLAVIT